MVLLRVFPLGDRNWPEIFAATLIVANVFQQVWPALVFGPLTFSKLGTFSSTVLFPQQMNESSQY
jgi:hypothetical protein